MENFDYYIEDMSNYLLQEKKKINEEIGARLRERRLEKNISISQLGEVIKTSPTYVSQIEKGAYTLSIFKFILFCNALDINATDLLEDFVFSRTENEELLIEKLQEEKNLAINILKFMKEKM